MCSVQIRNKMRPAKKCRPVAPLAWPVDHRWPLSFRISEIVKSCVIACGRGSCRGGGQGRVGSPSPIRYYSLFTCPPPLSGCTNGHFSVREEARISSQTPRDEKMSTRVGMEWIYPPGFYPEKSLKFYPILSKEKLKDRVKVMNLF